MRIQSAVEAVQLISVSHPPLMVRLHISLILGRDTLWRMLVVRGTAGEGTYSEILPEMLISCAVSSTGKVTLAAPAVFLLSRVKCST